MESLIFLYRCAADQRHASRDSFPGVRETGLFTHGRATLSLKSTPGVAKPCLFGEKDMTLCPRSAAPSDSIL